MRDIIFRGKRVDNGEWDTGIPFCAEDTMVIITDVVPFEMYGVENKRCSTCIPIDPATVGQYTGLTDKNGKRIFEGDIVVWTSEHTRLIGHYAYDLHKGYYKGDLLQVIYNEAGFMLATLADSMLDVPNANTKVDNYAFWNYHRQLEIIGNIHDNPELLK